MNLTLNAPLEVGFVIGCSAVVFFMQAGFCLLEAGLVRTKNSINVAVKNVMDSLIAFLLFVVFGFGLMFGVSQSGWIGNPLSIDFLNSPDLLGYFIFQAVFCGTAATIVSGAVAERARLSAYLITTVIVSGIVYPVIGHWIWGGAILGTGNGWLRQLGFVDWAGSVAVHVVGGFSALAAAHAIGPRRQVPLNGSTSGHSLTLAILGCFILWFGWWAFNGGSALVVDKLLPKVILNTNLGAVSGGLVAAGLSAIGTGRVNVISLINGILAGLVSVTGACHAIDPIVALALGGVGGVLMHWGNCLARHLKIDDAVGAFGVHGAAGLWGGMGFAFFAPTETLVCSSRIMQIGVQLLGCLAAALASYSIVYLTLKVVSRFHRLRVRAGEEKTGLNVSEHGATTEYSDLLSDMHVHRRTGDYSKNIRIEPNTEAGQIAIEYNQVISRVRKEVQEHEETNQWLRSERLRLQSILDNAGVGLYQMSLDGKIVSANSELFQFFGCADIDALYSPFNSALLPWQADHPNILALFEYGFRHGTAVKNIESELRIGDAVYWILESLVPIQDESGALLHWLGTLHDITERKQAMIAEIEIAEAKSQAKGQFLANMSHEIRTPLNGVIGMIDLLTRTSLDEKQSHYLTVANTSANTLLALINDVLDISKIEAGRFDLESIDFDLIELLESTAEQFADRAHLKLLELNCNLAKDLPRRVQGDPERLRQVLVNLLGNAIKFTEKGEVNLRVTRRGGTLRFAVQDSGIGISQAAQDRLFEAFMQADASTTRLYGGTGLGLAISSQIVRLMNGQLKVNSKVAKGTEFWFQLELPILSERQHDDRTNPLIARLKNCRVLIIDDNETNCEILVGQLSQWGFETSTCQKPTTVVERLLVAQRIGRPFDLVVLDFHMPEMDGRQVAIAIRDESSLSQVPILMLSSGHELLPKQTLENAGIQLVLTKPIRQSRLLDSIMCLMYDPSITQVQQPTPASDLELETRLPNPMATGSKSVNNETSSNNACQIEATNNSFVYQADVLVAEDNSVNQMVVCRMLECLGYTSEVAENGKDALEKFRTNRFGLILMDGHMPVMDGLLATREIRSLELEREREGQGLPRIPIVALTANVVQGIREQCTEAGMDGYLCKPITINRLKETVSKFIPQAEKRSGSIETNSVSIGATSMETPISLQDESACEIECPAELPFAQPTNLTMNPLRSYEEDVATTPQSNLSAELATSSHSMFDYEDTAFPQEWNELFDQAFLNEQCGGDREFQVQILKIMRDSLPQRLSDLKQANEARDWATVRSIAHQLKGAAGDSALVSISQTASEVETNAVSRCESSADGLIQNLSNRIDQTIWLLNQLLK